MIPNPGSLSVSPEEDAPMRQILRNLQDFLQSPSRHLLLDLRPRDAYANRHIVPSTNIPAAELGERWYELPSKHVPMGILDTTEGESTGWLLEKGWQAHWKFRDVKEFWQACEQAGVPVSNSDTLNSVEFPPKPWFLFSACPFLVRHAPSIEKALEERDVLRCLDLGCGSGRDLAWLLGRGRWAATGVDCWSGALERAEMLARGIGRESQLETWEAKIMSDGKWKFGERNSHRNGAEAAPHANHEPEFWKQETYDLILMVRFLARALLPQLPYLLRPGGYLLVSQFVTDGVHVYHKPQDGPLRLQLGELRAMYENIEGVRMEVVEDVVESIEDGRPVNSFLARRIA
ncbi:uncharacterized protein VTP21DRAFT_11032 [Calcarisporiella thermophila]|uniref:uncharacterized protein n=1 Tax=Calcarisporiella thermophila TaxID=911321 RepID=UPI0037448942